MAAAKKRVSFGAQPTKLADDWVADSVGDSQADNNAPMNAPMPEQKAAKAEKKTKRLTLDIDADLHKRLKIAALDRETTIVELARELFEQEFPPL